MVGMSALLMVVVLAAQTVDWMVDWWDLKLVVVSVGV